MITTIDMASKSKTPGFTGFKHGLGRNSEPTLQALGTYIYFPLEKETV
jgi:hypothetical protein